MTVYMGTNHLPEPPHPSVATLGVFDGVHLGHRKVIGDTVDWARQLQARSVVVTFDRHPAAVLGGAVPPMMTPLGHRLKLIERLGVDDIVVLHFTQTLAETPAERFVTDLLTARLGTVGLQLGLGTRFGAGAEGCYAWLVENRRRFELDVRQSPAIALDDQPVSATRIRRELAAGRLDEVARLLGRRFSLLGTVMHGDGRGRMLGYPTANLNTHHEATPPAGVYMGRVELDGTTYPALANIGRRPTFYDDGAETLVEVYLDGYSGDLYGRHLEFVFEGKLREEETFEDQQALVEQIERDLQRMRACLGSDRVQKCLEKS